MEVLAETYSVVQLLPKLKQGRKCIEVDTMDKEVQDYDTVVSEKGINL